MILHIIQNTPIKQKYKFNMFTPRTKKQMTITQYIRMYISIEIKIFDYCNKPIKLVRTHDSSRGH